MRPKTEEDGMELQQIEDLRQALSAGKADPTVREILCAMLARLCERGALTSQDIEAIHAIALHGGVEPKGTPNQARAGGSSRPDEPLEGNRLVDESSEESFPASDPPSFTPGTSAGEHR